MAGVHQIANPHLLSLRKLYTVFSLTKLEHNQRNSSFINLARTLLLMKAKTHNILVVRLAPDSGQLMGEALVALGYRVSLLRTSKSSQLLHLVQSHASTNLLCNGYCKSALEDKQTPVDRARNSVEKNEGNWCGVGLGSRDARQSTSH
ncbi:hypothetical protein CBL_11048 [Carabus blaptoides fortunei]